MYYVYLSDTIPSAVLTTSVATLCHHTTLLGHHQLYSLDFFVYFESQLLLGYRAGKYFLPCSRLPFRSVDAFFCWPGAFLV